MNFEVFQNQKQQEDFQKNLERRVHYFPASITLVLTSDDTADGPPTSKLYDPKGRQATVFSPARCRFGRN
ncbi:conserved hypothetical protein [Culex quinquefasciatus]|uniref:Uncharacterized protein n=1 Tax=Culex quinquefasciatus TaxID=7176 RepID=B0XGZ0_CULQU|nr:conserved hypothetical protein [Culex quinquefasciatus]|eukprot:XP_001868912.1 conserved hypothetical protein [Culex quinquefasciatus]